MKIDWERLILWHQVRANTLASLGEQANADLHKDWARAISDLLAERKALMEALNNVTIPR